MIGEESFFAGCQFLNFNKFQLSEKDRVGLEDKSDFNILMSIMCEKEKMHYKAQRKTVTQRYALIGTDLENTSIIVIRHSKLSDTYQYLKIGDKTYKIIDYSIDDSNHYMTYDFLTIKESKGVN